MPEELILEFYSDESSLFQNANQNWVIGGYVRPRVYVDGKSTSDSDVLAWWKDICAWFIKNCRPQIGEYMLAHCGVNINNKVRRSIQTTVLQMLLDKVAAVKGFPVVFFCPKGECAKNSEINYLTVLSYGYVQLLQELRRRFPDKKVRLVPLISKTDKTKYMAASSTPEELNRLHGHYRAALGIILYPYCSTGELNQIIDDLGIIYPTLSPYATEYGQMVDPKPEMRCNLQAMQTGKVKRNLMGADSVNLHNVVADYICNSYFSNIDDKGIEMIQAQEGAFICTVPRDMSAPIPAALPVEPIKTEEKKDVESVEEADKQEQLFTAVNKDTMERFNAADVYQQRSIIRALCAEIKPLVERQIDMETVLAELNDLLELAKTIHRPAVRAEMTANLLLFKIAVLNHLGTIYNVDELSREFMESVNRIADDFERNSLTFMFFNRQIVLNTDLNNFEKAEEYYVRAEKDWEKRLVGYADRFKHLEKDFAPSLSSVICPEYSKTIGSILQNMRHQMRMSSRAQRFGIYLKALNRARTAQFHMDEPADLSRIEQTMCDVECEGGYYDTAFTHLWKAAKLLSDAPTEAAAVPVMTAESCTYILEIAGKGGSENPFLLSHYARMMCELFISGESSALDLDRARIMMNALQKWQQNALSAHAYQGIRSIHPRTQILWKLGASACRSGMMKEGNKLLDAAFEQLSSADTGIFHAVGVAVRAEQAALNQANPAMIQDVQKLYEKFMDEKPDNMLDPFANCGIESIGERVGGKCEGLTAVSRRIAY